LDARVTRFAFGGQLIQSAPVRHRRATSPRLTRDLCASLGRSIVDPGPAAGLEYLSQQEYAALVDRTLAEAPDRAEFWLFAYGSLIWKPSFRFQERRIATLRGWHRSFCLKSTRWRGTPEHPGLILALRPGGQCRGVAYRLRAGTLREDVETTFRRELGVKPLNQRPRWVRVTTAEGNLRALAFAADPAGRSYVGELDGERTAAMIARAVGVWGSCAEYLYETISHLEELGIRDRALWRLQQLVAQKIVRQEAVP
jgi:cation transport protein ChaC